MALKYITYLLVLLIYSSIFVKNQYVYLVKLIFSSWKNCSGKKRAPTQKGRLLGKALFLDVRGQIP